MSVAPLVTECGHRFYILDPEREPLSQKISSTLTWFSPAFSPKDVPRFYDISSITENPSLFREVINAMARRYDALPSEERPTHVLGFDARGFLLGVPLALEMQIPFVMMRKAGKSPGLLYESTPYHKEYAEAKADTMAIRKDSINEGSRVVLVDDLIATGGTAVSGFELVEACGASVVEFAAVIGIPFLDGVSKIREFSNGKYKDVSVFTLVHDSSITDATCGDPKTAAAETPRITPCVASPHIGTPSGSTDFALPASQ